MSTLNDTERAYFARFDTFAPLPAGMDEGEAVRVMQAAIDSGTPYQPAASDLARAVREYESAFGERVALIMLPADEQRAAQLLRDAVAAGDAELAYRGIEPGVVI